MTITFLQPDGVAITAQQERQGQAATHGGGAGRPLGGRSGFRVDTASTVLSASSTTWTLTPCSVMIDPGATTHQGLYGWSTDANVTGAVTAADATYARLDIVYIQVNDSSAGDGSGATTAPVLYTAGTPSASPVAPTLPARSFLLGTISVPVSGGGSPTVILNPARYVAAGAPLPIASQTAQDALTQYPASEIVRTDDKYKKYISDGTKWMPHADALGLLSDVEVTSNSGAVTNTFVVVNNLTPFDFKGGRKYRITWDFGFKITAAGAPANVLIGHCASGDSAGLVTGVTQLQGRQIASVVGGQDDAHTLFAIYKPTSDVTRQIKWIANCPASAITFTAGATSPNRFSIEDLGAQF